MKKQILLCIIFILGAILCGCSSKEDKVIDYLNNKYQERFTYVSRGNDAWTSKAETFICSNNNGSEFLVQERADLYSDNYCSVLYDNKIKEKLSSVMPTGSKLFASTESCISTYTDKSMSLEEYMKEAGTIHVVILTTEGDNNNVLVDNLIEFSSGLVISGVIYQVSDEMFNEVDSFTESQQNTHDIIACESFWIEDKQLDD